MPGPGWTGRSLDRFLGDLLTEGVEPDDLRAGRPLGRPPGEVPAIRERSRDRRLARNRDDDPGDSGTGAPGRAAGDLRAVATDGLEAERLDRGPSPAAGPRPAAAPLEAPGRVDHDDAA